MCGLSQGDWSPRRVQSLMGRDEVDMRRFTVEGLRHPNLRTPRDWREASVSVRALIDDLDLWDLRPEENLSCEIIDSLSMALEGIGCSIRGLSKSFDQLAWSLEDFHGCLENRDFPRKYLLGSIDFLIDAAYLLANIYGCWGYDHLSLLETPMRNLRGELRASPTAHSKHKLRNLLNFIPKFKSRGSPGPQPVRSDSDLLVREISLPPTTRRCRKTRSSNFSNTAVSSGPPRRDEEAAILKRLDMILDCLSDAASLMVDRCESAYNGLKKYGAYGGSASSGRKPAQYRPSLRRYDKLIPKKKNHDTKRRSQIDHPVKCSESKTNIHPNIMDLAYVLDYKGGSSSMRKK